MVRIGLSLYLMFAAAAGPWLCCCTTQRLVALFAPPARQAHPSCCAQHRHATRNQGQRTHQQHPRKQDHPGRLPCPCQEDGQQRVPVASLDSEVAKQLQSRDSAGGSVELVAGVPTALCLSLEGGTHTSGRGLVLPFLTSQDILHTLHILRC